MEQDPSRSGWKSSKVETLSWDVQPPLVSVSAMEDPMLNLMFVFHDNYLYII